MRRADAMNGQPRWRPGALMRNTGHASLWALARALMQAASAVLLARQFGAAGYGLLTGATALYVIAQPLAGLGTGLALVRRGAVAPVELDALWRRTFYVSLLTGCLLMVLLVPAAAWMSGEALSLQTLVGLSAAELVAAPVLLTLAYRYQAQERMGGCGLMLAVAPSARLLAVLIALLLGLRAVEDFALLYAALVGGTALLAVMPRLRTAGPVRTGWRDWIRQGLPYVIPGAASTASAEADKAIALSSLPPQVLGHYAAAFRVAQALVLPVVSLVLAVTPRLFRETSRTRFAAHLSLQLRAAMAYATVAAIVLWCIAPFLPRVFGASFEAAVPLARLLSLYLFANIARQICLAALTGGDMQWTRNKIEIVSAMLTVLGAICLIPRLGAEGAVWSLCGADALAALAAAIVLRRRLRILPGDSDMLRSGPPS